MITTPERKRLKEAGRGRGEQCAVVAILDASQADLVRRLLGRLGWCARMATTAAEVRRFLREAPGSVVVLGTELTDESGWLTCAKLMQPRGVAKVLMFGPSTPRNRHMARMVGAAAIVDDPAALADWLS